MGRDSGGYARLVRDCEDRLKKYIENLLAMEFLEKGYDVYCEMKKYGVIYNLKMDLEKLGEQIEDILDFADSYRFYLKGDA